MKTLINKNIIPFMLLISMSAAAQDVIELDTTTIMGNTELPKAMYVVPWQDKTRKNNTEQKLVLHNLYSDLFNPVMPAYIPEAEFSAPKKSK